VAEPSVVAVVVNWNGRDLLSACLETLLASTYPRLRILVVDNASTDGSRELLRETFPAVGLIENHENMGYAAGANAGIGVALAEDADYVLLLNNDLEIAEDAISRLVETAASRPDAAFIGPLIYYHDPPDLIWSAGGEVSYWTGNIRHVGIRERDRGQHERVSEVDYLTGCAVLASARAISDVGLLDEDYFMYNEDTDWCARALRGGYSVLLDPRAKVWHKVSMSSGGGLTPFKIYHRLRSTFRYFARYARWYQWIGIIPASIWRTATFVVGELLKGHPGNAGAVFRGIFDTARGAGRV
jgi:GT2 family glycosyltransferase